MKEKRRKLLSLALASTIIAGIPTIASAEDEIEETYVVQSGDTLGNISFSHYGNSIYYESLAKYNNIEDANEIYEGQVIKIPKTLEYNYESNTMTVNSYEPDKTYIVQENDTLYCIVNTCYGLKNQESVDKLATYNGLSDPNKLYVGQVLQLPCVEKLLLVVQNDYTEEYNQMGWILHHDEYSCHRCEPPVFIIEHRIEKPIDDNCKRLNKEFHPKKW